MVFKNLKNSLIKLKQYGHYSGLSKEKYESISDKILESNAKNVIVIATFSALMMTIMLILSFFSEILAINRLGYLFTAAMSFITLFAMCGRWKKTKLLVQLCVYTLQITFIVFGIYLGNYIKPDQLSLCFTVLMFASPLLFTDKTRNTNILVIGSTLLYILSASYTQTPEMLKLNLSYVIPFSIASLFISTYLMKMKIEKIIFSEEAARSSDAKTDFLANMSHEIRTPLNAILGLTDLALREKMSEEAAGYIHQIKSSGKNLLVIINDILDYSKISSGKMTLTEETYEPLSLVNNLTSIVNTRIGDKPVEFTIDIPPDIPSRLSGDSVRIHQIILNLLTNAVKFTKSGEVKLTIKCTKINSSQDMLKVCVSDTGQGIKSEDIGKLFSSFQQVDSRRNRNIEGTGLGLAICKQLVTLMNGHISVNSTYGEGSTFSFEIPQKVISREPSIPILSHKKLRTAVFSESEYEKEILRKNLSYIDSEYIFFSTDTDKCELENYDFDFIITDDTAVSDDILSYLENNRNTKCIIISPFINTHANSHINAKIINKPVYVLNLYNALGVSDVSIYSDTDDSMDIFTYSAPDAHILIVDDNTVNLAVAKGLLEPLDMQIDTAVSAVDALEKCAVTRYDLVFMDHMMPLIDGIEGTGMIRESLPEYNDIPIIALTANAMGNAREMFISAGLNDFVAKPIELKTIISKLTKWLPDDKIIKRTDIPAAEAGSVTVISDEPVSVSKIPYIPGLNTEDAIALLGNENLFLTVLKAYCAAYEKNAETIRNHWENGDIKNYTIEVHSLKSTSRQIGAEELGALAAELEQAGKNENTELISEKTETLLSMYRKCHDAVLSALGGEEKAPQTENSKKSTAELLDEIAEAVSSFDTLAIDSVLNEISSADFSAEEASLFDELKDAAEGCDSGCCEEIISKWKNIIDS